MFKSQTGPPQVSKMSKYSESPLSQLPYLELFQSVGGASQGVFGGGQSRDIFRGGPVKKITLYNGNYVYKYISNVGGKGAFKTEYRTFFILALTSSGAYLTNILHLC